MVCTSRMPARSFHKTVSSMKRQTAAWQRSTFPIARYRCCQRCVSHDKGSLEAGKCRAALSLLADVSADGEILRYEVKPSVIVSDAALSYDEADAAISDADEPYHDLLANLHSLTEALKQQREAAGAVNIDRSEMLIKVVSSNDVQVKVVERTSPARQMVAECMVLCNSLLASFCRDNDIPAAYRSQTAPDLSDLGAGLPPGGGDRRRWPTCVST